MADRKSVSRGFSKNDWLEAALEMMGEGSLSDLTIEGLARRLDISKSGFYWHFRSRQALLDELLEYWSVVLTETITKNKDLVILEPRQRLLTAAEAILEQDLGRHDLAVRHWACKDKNAERAVRRVTKARLDFVRTALEELGIKGDELEMRAMLYVAYHTWESFTFAGMSKKRRRELIKRRIELLVS